MHKLNTSFSNGQLWGALDCYMYYTERK